GLLVHDRQVYSFGWAGPAAAFRPGGDVVMGTPRALPAMLSLPNSKHATVGAWDGVPLKGDQVGVYGPEAGSQITIPAGSTGFVVGSTEPLNLLHGTNNFTNSTGLKVKEPVTGFRFSDPAPAAKSRAVIMPFVKPVSCASGICPSNSVV